MTTKTVRLIAVLIIAALLAGLMAIVVVPSARAATAGKNGMYAFTSKVGPHATDIWVSSPNGTGLEGIPRKTRLNATAKIPGNHSQPDWSPEGGPHLGFITQTPGKPGDIWWTTQYGKEPFRATNTPDIDEQAMAFAPGGGNIVYQRAVWNNGRPGDYDIWAIQLMGGNPRPLVYSSSNDITPAWSQDSTLIAFASDRGPGDGYRLFIGNLRSATQPAYDIVRIANFGTHPNWNPTQRQIVFEHAGNIWLVPIDPELGVASGRPKQLTRHPKGELDSRPEFSPDQDRIIFQRGNRLFTMKTDGTGLRKIDFIGFDAQDPDWRPECSVGPRTDKADTVRGTPKGDLFCPSEGKDVWYGLGGNDVMIAGLDANRIYGGSGSDLIGTGGDRAIAGDFASGGGGDDFITGSPKADRLYGGNGADKLVGQEGDDKLFGKDKVKGNDYLVGSKGDDTCSADKRDIVFDC